MPAQHEILAVYGAKNKADAVRRVSFSGGMFTLFAENILQQGAEYNLAVSKSLPLHPQRKKFFEQLERYTLKEMVKKCLN